VTKFAINQLLSQQLCYKCTLTTATLTHAAEMTLLADKRLLHNDVPVVHATATLNMAKIKIRLKILIKSNLFISMMTMSQAFYCNLLLVVSVFILQGLTETISFRENGIFYDVTITLAILSKK